MRSRAYRRYVAEKWLKRRLRDILDLQNYHWRGIIDINHNKFLNPKIVNLIATQQYFKAKTISTEKHITKIKIKYSPNHSKSWYRDNKKLKTREYQKRVFLKELRENGIV